MKIEYVAGDWRTASAVAINQHHVISGPAYCTDGKWRFLLTDELLTDLEARGFEVKLEVHI